MTATTDLARLSTPYWQRTRWQTWLLIAVLIGGGFVMLYPFAWLVLSAFKLPADIIRIPPTLWPEEWSLEAFQVVLSHKIGGGSLTRSYLNSLFVTITTVIAVLITSTLGGYCFARLRFPLREPLFYFVLSTTMVPFLTLLIPLYVVMDRLELLNTLWVLIVPSVFSSFGIFLCRQFVYGIPVELYDAAKIDGAGDFTIYTRIIVGMMKPVISVLAIFSFRATFNDYLWPLVTITDGGNYTLPLALRGIGNLTKKTDKLSGQLASVEKELRGELKSEITGLRDELKSDIVGVKGEITGLRGELKSDIAGLRTDLRTEIRESERRLGTRIDGLSDRIDAVHSEMVEARVAMSDRVARLELSVFGVPLRDTGTDPA